MRHPTSDIPHPTVHLRHRRPAEKRQTGLLIAAVLAVLSATPSCRKEPGTKTEPPNLAEVLQKAVAGLPTPEAASMDPLMVEQFERDYAEVMNPRNLRRLPELSFNVAMLLHGQGYLDHARDWYTFVLELLKRPELRGFDDGPFLTRYYLADVFERQGRTAESQMQLSAALSLRGDDVAALLRRAEWLLKLNASGPSSGGLPPPDAEVRRAFEKVLEKADLAPAWFGLGQLEASRQRPKEAEECFRKALTLAPEYRAARTALADLLRANGRGEESEAVLVQAPARPDGTGFVDPHLRVLERRTSRDALRLAHYWRLADSGRAEEAEASLRFDLLQRPDDPAALNLLGGIVLTRRLPRAEPQLHPLLLAEAKRCFLNALAGDAGLLEARFNYALALLAENNRDGAIEQFREILLRRDDYWKAHFQIAELYFRDPVPARRDLPTAEAHYRKTIAYDPDNMHAYGGLVALVEEQGRYEEAHRLLREATLRSPDDPGIADQLARFLLDVPRPELRDPVRAQLIAERVCEVTRLDFPEYLETLARAYVANAQLGDTRNIELLQKARQTIRHALDSAAAQQREDLLPRLRGVRDQIESWLREAGRL